MADGNHTIDIVIKTNDMTDQGLRTAQANLTRFDSAIRRTTQRIANLSQRGYKVTLGLIDRVSEPGGRINAMLKKLAGSTYRISLGLQNRASAGISEVESRLSRLASRAYTVAITAKEKVSGNISALKDGLTSQVLGVGSDMLVGAGISYGIYDTIKTYKDFSAQMSAVGAISGATSDEMEILTNKAREMGEKTSFSASEAGKAFEYMAMAGWKTADMTAGIEGIMNLAAASGEQLGTVSDIVTDALTAFGLQASDSAHFADVLAAASSNSNTNVGMMGYTFKYVAPLAGALKYSIEDVSLAIGLMANAGIKGEQAGTSLRTILTNLSNPGQQTAAAMEKLGVSIKNSDGTVKPFMQTLQDLRKSFNDLSDVDKIQFASDIAGADAQSGLLAIVNASEGDFSKLTSAILGADGAAKNMADTRLDNLGGDLTLLASAWESFQIALMKGSGANFMREFLQGVTKDISKLSEYMKDGLDISDVGRLALDILKQLKDKFLELDGVGSILAGGVLVAGLGKIASLSLKAVDALKGVTGGHGSSHGASAGSSVGSMVVHAQSVVVNGSTATSAVDAAGSIGEAGGTGTRAGGKGKLSRLGKMAGKVALPLMATMGAYDIYSTYEQNNIAIAEADSGISAANEKASLLEQYGMQSEADKVRADAEAYKKETETYNTNRMNGAIGENIGGVAGGVIGGAIGSLVGPGGTVAGATIGGMAGGALGGFIGENWESTKEGASEAFNSISDIASNEFEYISNSVGSVFDSVASAISGSLAGIGSFFAGLGSSIVNSLSAIGNQLYDALWVPITDAAITAINFLVGAGALIYAGICEKLSPLAEWFNSAVWSPLQETASESIDYVSEIISEGFAHITEGVASFGEYLSSFVAEACTYLGDQATAIWEYISGVYGIAAEWFNSAVWSPIQETANTAAVYIQTALSNAWDYITEIFGVAASWFDSVVWNPVSSSVVSVKSSISYAFQRAYDSVVGIFSRLASWFEANVIDPVKAKFDKLVSFGSSIASVGSSITGLHTSSDKPKANGGFVLNEQHALIGEAGPEVIIPLSSSKRSRAVDLMQRAWDIIGGGSPIGASGADVLGDDYEGDSLADGINFDGFATPAESVARGNSNTGNFSVDIGGVNMTVNISSDNAGSPDDIIRTIKENLENLADDVAGQMAQKLKGIYGNQPVLNMG